MDRRTVLAITLCFLIYLGWQKFYLEPRIPHQPQTTTQRQSAPAPQAPPGVSAETQTPAPPVHHFTEKTSLPTGTGTAVIGNSSRFIVGWTLHDYTVGVSPSTPPVDLKFVTQQPAEMDLAFDDPAYAYLANVDGKLTKTATGVQWTYEDSKVKLTRTFETTPKQNYILADVTAQFKGGHHPNYAFLSLYEKHVKKDPEVRDRSLMYFTKGSVERVAPKGADLKQVSTPIQYIGAGSRYFVMALLNNGPIAPTGLVQPLGKDKTRVSMVYPVNSDTVRIPVKVFFGAKDPALLRSVNPALYKTIDFGFFTSFASLILRFLNWIHQYVSNYGVAIIILTLVLKGLTYPLTYKSMKSMKEMQRLQPQLQKIREKYKDDKEALNRETLQIMKTHGYNPLAGCLPMLIQLPIFWALYRVLYSSVDLYHAPFFGYIHDLSAKDPYYIMPIVLAAMMFFQQKLTPTQAAADPAQQKMMQFMPLIFGAFMLALPSGLNLYMIANSLASIVQQLFLNRKFDTQHAPTALAGAR